MMVHGKIYLLHQAMSKDIIASNISWTEFTGGVFFFKHSNDYLLIRVSISFDDLSGICV